MSSVERWQSVQQIFDYNLDSGGGGGQEAPFGVDPDSTTPGQLGYIFGRMIHLGVTPFLMLFKSLVGRMSPNEQGEFLDGVIAGDQPDNRHPGQR